MWANGNGGQIDDCAASGFAASIYTISVGAMGLNRYPSSYDEECSAKMVTAYVTDIFGHNTIVSVTCPHKYTHTHTHASNLTLQRTSKTGRMCDEGFSGTSAATPMVSGGIALALEAK